MSHKSLLLALALTGCPKPVTEMVLTPQPATLSERLDYFAIEMFGDRLRECSYVEFISGEHQLFDHGEPYLPPKGPKVMAAQVDVDFDWKADCYSVWWESAQSTVINGEDSAQAITEHTNIYGNGSLGLVHRRVDDLGETIFKREWIDEMPRDGTWDRETGWGKINDGDIAWWGRVYTSVPPGNWPKIFSKEVAFTDKEIE